MAQEDSSERWLRFYGPGDLASLWSAGDAVALVRGFDPMQPPGTVAEVIELYNAHLFINAGFVPTSLTDAERGETEEKSSQARSAVARFFTGIDSSNLEDLIRDVPFQYRGDLLTLLGTNRAYERCDASQMLEVLKTNRVRVGDMLASKKLVQAYDAQVRDLLMEDARNAEILTRHYFGDDQRAYLYLPPSFTPADARELMSRYVRSPEVNSNYVALIKDAPISSATGVDAKLKLEATRRYDGEVKAMFEKNEGIKSGVELRIVDDQDEPVLSRTEGMVEHHSYSRKWLEATTDYPSVLNHFQHLFEFANHDVLLTLPASPADLGIFERLSADVGRTGYRKGIVYQIRDASSTLQTQLAQNFLGGEGIQIESVIAWFFEEYLPAEFDAHGFTFTPSSKDASFLEKTRHLLIEMESVARQFELYARDGEIDRDLLAIASDTISYKLIPTLNDEKYLYATEDTEIQEILRDLFSDQSAMGYIREDLQAHTLAELLLYNTVTNDDFEGWQRTRLERLTALGVLHDTGERIQITSGAQFLILLSLFRNGAASYPHLTDAGRDCADEMVTRGWLRRESALLTAAEASYFNYQLNKQEFSNGPELRNKYIHAAQKNEEGPGAHFTSYIVALKLIIALIIKINDDFDSAS